MNDEMDHTQILNGMQRGFDAAMGFEYTRVTRNEVAAELTVSEVHLQQYGLVHGGVHAGLIEVLCSAGAAINAMAEGMAGSVGLENSTSFVRAVRKGVLRGVAKPLHKGRRVQVWEARVEDDKGRLVATGRVRLMNLDKGVDPLAR